MATFVGSTVEALGAVAPLTSSLSQVHDSLAPERMGTHLFEACTSIGRWGEIGGNSGPRLLAR